MANSSRTFKTEQGSVGGSGGAYNLSRQICIVSSSGMFVNNELTSNEHMISFTTHDFKLFSYHPDHFPIFVGRSMCFLGTMFKKATDQRLLVNVCQLTRHKILFKRFTVTVVKLGVFSI